MAEEEEVKEEEGGRVRLNLYDVLGRSLREVTNEELQKGVHTFHVERLNLSPGNYFYRLETVGSIQQKMMTIY